MRIPLLLCLILLLPCNATSQELLGRVPGTVLSPDGIVHVEGRLLVGWEASAVPLHGAVQPGESWNFQCWHRDLNPNPTSNFSDAVTILFE